MTPARNKKLIFLILIFVIALVLYLSGPDFIDTNNPSTNNIIHLASRIAVWIFAAAIVNNIVQRFLRSGKKDKDIDRSGSNFLYDFVTILLYTVSIAAIIGFVFDEAITGFWLLILSGMLLLGLALRTEIFRFFPALSFDFSKPLQEGDWIKVNANVYTPEIVGKIVSQNRKSIFVMCESNTLTMIPRKLLDDLIITNYKGPEYKTKFNVEFTIDFSVPVERAKRVLQAGSLQAMEHQGFLKKKHPEVLIKETSTLGITYQVFFWINPWKTLSPSEAKDIIINNVLKHINKAGITLAYPKEDVYFKEMPIRQIDSTSVTDRKSILSNIELFSSFDEDELDYLSNNILQKIYVQSEEVVTSGAQGDSMFILVEGLCDVLADTDSGERVNVGQIAPGQFFGEMSLLTGEPRSATVVADTDCLIYVITKNHIEEVFKKRPETVEEISNIVAERKIKTMQTVEDSEQHRDTLASQIIKGIRNFFDI